ncbi:MAG: hypothetical protein AAGA10_19075 [Bacteroidota bacterium]
MKNLCSSAQKQKALTRKRYRSFAGFQKRFDYFMLLRGVKHLNSTQLKLNM